MSFTQTGDLASSQQCRAQYKSYDICKRTFLCAKVKEHISTWPHRIAMNFLRLAHSVLELLCYQYYHIWVRERESAHWYVCGFKRYAIDL